MASRLSWLGQGLVFTLPMGKFWGHHEDHLYWLSVGAQPSEPVQRILFRAGVLPPPPMMVMGRKGGPRDTRPVDPMTGRILTLEKPLNADQAKDSEGGGGYPGSQESLFLLGYPPEKQPGLA